MSCGRGGGYVTLLKSFREVFNGETVGYYSVLDEIVQKYPNINSRFSGSIYSIATDIKEREFSVDLVQSILGYNAQEGFAKPRLHKGVSHSETPKQKVVRLKKEGDIQKILNYCVELQERTELMDLLDIGDKIFTQTLEHNLPKEGITLADLIED